MSYCTQCGASMREGANFCHICGQAAEVKEHAAPESMAVPAPPVNEPPAFPVPLAEVVQPLPGERALRIWRCRYLNYGPKELAEGTPGLVSSGKGLLIATNLRLLYVRERGALRTARHEILENLPYSSVRGLEARGNEVLVALKDEEALTPRFMDATTVDWERLKGQGRVVPEELHADLQRLFGSWASQGAGGKGEEVLDYSILKAKADRAGIAVPAARCPKCGAGVPLPPVGNVARCPRCDGAMFPQDVVKRIRIAFDLECRNS